MIIQKNEHSFNRDAMRFRPNKDESIYIHYQLKQHGYSFESVSIGLDIGRATVRNIVFGHRRSRRVEAEIARILGAESWNHLVTEANLVVSGARKPTKNQVDKALQDRLKKQEQLLSRKRAKLKQHIKEAV